MKAILLTAVLLTGFSAQAKTIDHCTPESPRTAGFNYVQVSMDDRADYSLAIEWNRPVGREDVQEVAADYYDDFTMQGYYAESLEAALAFYDDNDIDGERTVFEIDGHVHPVTCRR
ncbi:MAG: hypothetical protein IPM97_15775 [Bdellovibrionaceae bacterium]|nr:hypothetical protein [Pseudobdellovibrionaceae bacterium]